MCVSNTASLKIAQSSCNDVSPDDSAMELKRIVFVTDHIKLISGNNLYGQQKNGGKIILHLTPLQYRIQSYQSSCAAIEKLRIMSHKKLILRIIYCQDKVQDRHRPAVMCKGTWSAILEM
jgi:hypothetical protein